MLWLGQGADREGGVDGYWAWPGLGWAALWQGAGVALAGACGPWRITTSSDENTVLVIHHDFVNDVLSFLKNFVNSSRQSTQLL